MFELEFSIARKREGRENLKPPATFTLLSGGRLIDAPDFGMPPFVHALSPRLAQELYQDVCSRDFSRRLAGIQLCISHGRQ